jgi:hypothetical protein
MDQSVLKIYYPSKQCYGHQGFTAVQQRLCIVQQLVLISLQSAIFSGPWGPQQNFHSD